MQVSSHGFIFTYNDWFYLFLVEMNIPSFYFKQSSTLTLTFSSIFYLHNLIDFSEINSNSSCYSDLYSYKTES